jgi:hypothetical protein
MYKKCKILTGAYIAIKYCLIHKLKYLGKAHNELSVISDIEIMTIQGVSKKVTSIEITLLLLISGYCTSGNSN